MHNIFGIATFMLSMTTIFLGYRTAFFDKYVDSEFTPFISLVTIIVTVLSVYGSLQSLISKIKRKM